MRLTGIFSGREALVSQGAALASIADNLANVNTVGFKGTRSEFANIIADSIGSLYGSELNPGNGAKVADSRTLHNKQGSLEFTDRGLDLGIQGNGYFLVTDGTSNFLTRAGVFSTDKDGNIINPEGDNLMGFTAASPDTPVALKVANGQVPAVATTTAKITGNLNTGDPVVTLPADTTTFEGINSGSSFRSSVSVLDSLGQSHDVSLYFFHTANLTYDVQAYVDSGETSLVPGTPVSVGSGQLTFDATGLQAVGGAPINISATWANGASASAVALDLTTVTGFASPSAFAGVTRDGNQAGNITGYEVAADGTLNGLLDSGGTTTVGTVVLADVPNRDGLEKIGNNKFTLGFDTGTMTVGQPTTEGRGEIVGGALENSTVDPANEFVDMIRYQRGYQAGSQVIRTISELLGSTIQIA